MKNLLYLFLLVPVSLLAQTKEYGSFRIVNSEIVYQKVFNKDSITNEKLAEFIKTIPNVTNVQASGTGVTADLTALTVDYKKFHFTQVATPPIIQTGTFSGKITSEAKAGKYRITVTAIQMKGEMGYKKIPNPENMTNYATMNSATILSRDWCKPTMLGLLDQAFTDIFTIKAQATDAAW